MEKAVNIIERVHSEAQGLFLVHNSPSHRKVSDDDLNADKRKVGLKGKQSIMRESTWNVALQSIVWADGKAKGMKMNQEERRVEKTCEKYWKHLDFKNQKNTSGKLHWREQVWCYSRGVTINTWPGTRGPGTPGIGDSRTPRIGDPRTRCPREKGIHQFGDPDHNIPSDMGIPGRHITRDMGPWGHKNSGDMGIP